ncbi:MAG: acyl carrier protein [Lachnospiraceae bacterium]|nr:acyl carrier protein [Lachnospiraceae bacterium]
MREEIIEILQSVHPEVDYEVEDKLIDNRIFDSFDVVSVVSELIDNFDVEITAETMIPENFNSVDAIMNLIKRLEEE